MKGYLFIFGLIVAILNLPFVFPETGLTSEIGVTDTFVKVGSTMDMSGPIAFVGKVVSAGMQMYFKKVNDAGGIHGRKIIQIIEDDGYNPSKTRAAVKKLLEVDKVFALVGVIGTPCANAIFDLVMEGKVPLVGIGGFARSGGIPPKRYIFHVHTTYYDQARILIDYIWGDLGAKEAKIASICQMGEYCDDVLSGLEAQAKLYGLKVIAKEGYNPGQIDFNPQVVRVMKSGADHVILGTVYRETAAILKEAKKLGWNPRFFITSAAADDITLKLSGPAAEGLLGVHTAELLDSSMPGVVEYRESLEKFAPTMKPAFYNMYGWTYAKIFCEGLRRAGRELTRENFVKAMETFKNYETGIGPSLTFGPELRAGSKSAYIIKADLQKGSFIRLTDYRNPKEIP